MINFFLWRKDVEFWLSCSLKHQKMTLWMEYQVMIPHLLPPWESTKITFTSLKLLNIIIIIIIHHNKCNTCHSTVAAELSKILSAVDQLILTMCGNPKMGSIFCCKNFFVTGSVDNKFLITWKITQINLIIRGHFFKNKHRIKRKAAYHWDIHCPSLLQASQYHPQISRPARLCLEKP